MRVCVVIATLALTFSIFVNVESETYCENIKRRYSPTKQSLRIREDRDSNLLLYWGSEPGRAAAALFAVVVRHALGYQHVYLKKGRQNLNQLIKLRKLKPIARLNEWEQYGDIAVVLSTAWEPTSALMWTAHKNYKSGLAGLRLEEFGTSPVPVRQQVYVYLAERFRHLPQCIHANQWSFFVEGRAAELMSCGFANITLSYDEMSVTVHGLSSTQRDMAEALAVCTETPLRHIILKKIDRKTLLQIIRTTNQSFLFIDYDMWSGYPNLSAVQLPPCIPGANYLCQQGLDTTIAMRVADVSLLKDLAPQLFQLAHNFTPSVESIREILELESDRNDIENAACEWASKHDNIIDAWVQEYRINIYEIATFYCMGNPDYNEYDKVLEILNNQIEKLTKPANISVILTKYAVNCSDENDFKVKLKDIIIQLRDRLIGAIVGKVNGVVPALDDLSWANLPVMSYDATSPDIRFVKSAWLATGQSLHLALALKHFIFSKNCTQVLVLSEPTAAAKRWIDNLRAVGGLQFHNRPVKLHISHLDVEAVLNDVKMAHAGIILLNMNDENAATILSASANVKIYGMKDVTWIVRDWRTSNIKTDSNVKHYTISSLCRCGKNISKTEGLQQLRDDMDKVWPNCTWPTHVLGLADAVLTLVNGFKAVIHKYPKARDDPHNYTVMKLLEESLIEESVTGLIQNLTYKGHALEDIIIFIVEWRGGSQELLARWRINTTSRTVHVESQKPSAFNPLKCTVRFETLVLPISDNRIWMAFSLILLMPSIIAVTYILLHYLHKKYQYAKKNIMMHLPILRINRSMLELRQKIGTGQFDDVRFAVLRIKRRTSQPVVAKAFLTKNSGSVRAVSTLAILNHNNIIRLVGVCIDNEPPLLLFEVAFFGNLLQYLRSRRHLVEGAASEVEVNLSDNSEAIFVTAEPLTRLARQAASALAYLSIRRILHRNVCASNCLVDANRSLKLSGFNMAIEMAGINWNEDNSYQQCQIIPSIHVMAPECFQGEFSTASDVWAFGVLVFELVTLGAYPYENMSSQEIIGLVSKGGMPRLPRDASIQTQELVQLCWQRGPTKRATAGELVTFLESRPSSLRPALHQNNKQSAVSNILSESAVSLTSESII